MSRWGGWFSLVCPCEGGLLSRPARALAYPDERRARPDGEADLICVVDGVVHLCEVKSSSRAIELESLVEVAKRLRPDVVTLAVMEARSPKVEAKHKELAKLLEGTGIEAALLTKNSRPGDDQGIDLYLP